MTNQTILRVLNSIDYSLLNELNRVEKPTATALLIGKMVCEFVAFVSSPSTFAV